MFDQTGNPRELGFRDALMKDPGLPVDEKLFFEGDLRPETGRQSYNHYVTYPFPPTAVFVCNDMMAIGVIKGAVEKGYRSRMIWRLLVMTILN